MLTFFCWYSGIWPLIPTKDDDELPCLSTLAFPSYLARRHPPGLFQYPIGNTAGYGSHIASFHSTCQYCTHLRGILVQGLYQPIRMLVLSTRCRTGTTMSTLGPDFHCDTDRQAVFRTRISFHADQDPGSQNCQRR